MKKISIAFLLGILICSFTIKSFAQQDQRIHAAYMLAFGRDASQGEVNYWLTRGNLSIAQLIEFNRQGLSQYPDLHRQTIIQAYIDAFGRNPKQDELNTWMKTRDTYTEIMKSHIAYLVAGYGDEYTNVIKRSYQYVFGRQPNSGELNYWKGQPVYSYVMLVGQHQDYQRRNIAKESSANQVNLNNSPSLVTVSLSPAIGAEASRAAGLVSQGGGNLVSQGAGNLITNDGGSLVAAGAGNLVAAGAGN